MVHLTSHMYTELNSLCCDPYFINCNWVCALDLFLLGDKGKDDEHMANIYVNINSKNKLYSVEIAYWNNLLESKPNLQWTILMEVSILSCAVQDKVLVDKQYKMANLCKREFTGRISGA